MSNLVQAIDARRDLQVPAMSSVMQETCASMTAAEYRRTAFEAAAITTTWLHTPKFGPNHHSQRWRPAS